MSHVSTEHTALVQSPHSLRSTLSRLPLPKVGMLAPSQPPQCLRPHSGQSSKAPLSYTNDLENTWDLFVFPSFPPSFFLRFFEMGFHGVALTALKDIREKNTQSRPFPRSWLISRETTISWLFTVLVWAPSYSSEPALLLFIALLLLSCFNEEPRKLQS